MASAFPSGTLALGWLWSIVPSWKNGVESLLPHSNDLSDRAALKQCVWQWAKQFFSAEGNLWGSTVVPWQLPILFVVEGMIDSDSDRGQNLAGIPCHPLPSILMLPRSACWYMSWKQIFQDSSDLFFLKKLKNKNDNHINYCTDCCTWSGLKDKADTHHLPLLSRPVILS